VTRVELIEKVSISLKLNADVVGRTVTELLNEMTEAFKRGEEVKFAGYGTFRVKTLKPRSYKFKKEAPERTIVRLYVGRKSKWKSTQLSKKSNKSPERKSPPE
jgi:nucleoid DNA-binding protein